MKTRSLLILAIASIMTISTADAHPLSAQRTSSIDACNHNKRGKMARIKAHKMRHHMVARPFMRKMRSPRVGVAIVL
jgi:hypothetical protein